MSKEILLVADAVSNEKGVDKGLIFEAIEVALATATKKRYDEDSTIEVIIDRKTGDYETYRTWEVVDDDTLAELGTQFTTEEAAEKDASLAVGDVYREQV
jgi:N utilization substance protein A